MGERKVKITVLDVKYTTDTNIPCIHNLGNINTCGMRKDGSMFPYCAIGDIGVDNCPQVLKTLIASSVDPEETK